MFSIDCVSGISNYTIIIINDCINQFLFYNFAQYCYNIFNSTYSFLLNNGDFLSNLNNCLMSSCYF